MSQASPHLAAYKDQAMKEFAATHKTLEAKRRQVNENYVNPATLYVQAQAKARPIPTLLLAIYFATSFFPVLTFLVWTVGTILLVGGSALAFALFWIGVLVAGAGLALLGTLVVTGFISAFIAFWTLAAYLSFRLLAHVTKAPSVGQGIKGFDSEVRAFVFGGSATSGGSLRGGLGGTSDEDVKVPGGS